MKIFAILILTMHSMCVMAQTDTTIIRSVQGLIFMPAYHSGYDQCCPGEMSTGHNDYFFPTDAAGINILRSQNVEIAFRNCMRINNYSLRAQLKKKSTRFINVDTAWETHWYGNSAFYMIPVKLSYKQFRDNFPKMMSSDSFVLQIQNGARILFFPKREAIIPINIEILNPCKAIYIRLSPQ